MCYTVTLSESGYRQVVDMISLYRNDYTRFRVFGKFTYSRNMLLYTLSVSIKQGSIVAITPEVQSTDLEPFARALKTRLGLPDPLPNIEAALRDVVRTLGTPGAELAWKGPDGITRRYDEGDPGFVVGGFGKPVERRHHTLAITVASPRWRPRS